MSVGLYLPLRGFNQNAKNAILALGLSIEGKPYLTNVYLDSKSKQFYVKRKSVIAAKQRKNKKLSIETFQANFIFPFSVIKKKIIIIKFSRNLSRRFFGFLIAWLLSRFSLSHIL